ncbi:hypothetical protein SAY86_018387 [Trapa natans]|uniref:BHLH domain-containing protein n=1 Tax=Trapa natans TaxID=22666 RepID=A0AAN7LGT2_TRANT|nr:hypothetical protein SAY86_018387 [Trapa natans]
MDRGGRDGIEQELSNQDPINYSSSCISPVWPFCSTNISNAPTSSVDPAHMPAVCKENLIGSSSCSSAPVADPFGPPALWDQTTTAHTMVGYRDITLQKNLTNLNILGGANIGLDPALLRGDVGWNPPISMPREGIFLANTPGMLPPSLTQIPADSGFIERAARFSCFSGGGLGDTANPLSGADGIGVCPRGVVRMPISVQGEVFPANSVKLLPTIRDNIHIVESSKDAVVRSEYIQYNGEQTKQVVGGSGDDSSGPEFNEGGDHDENEENGLGSKKRKRNGKDAEFREPAEDLKEANETRQKLHQSPNSASGKAAGKNNKQVSQASEPPKEFIHVRARRGQATNSHSLAERVRREKISERMKFLQELVPGCSKVTGKAVMLDEIINYVQSLQRQVEFLSMKLATVNPRLDFNIEGLLTKDILHSRAGPSSILGFFSDMTLPYPPPVHPSQPGLIPAGLNGTGIPDSLRDNHHNQINPVGGGGSKGSALLPNLWEDELNHVVQMGFNGADPLSSQDTSDGTHAKVEL